jgi:antitoxin MazE
MQVARWGNSLAIRLPVAVVKALDLHEGDDVTIDVAGARQLQVEKTPEASELLARLRRWRGSLPDGFRFDRLEANAR